MEFSQKRYGYVCSTKREFSALLLDTLAIGCYVSYSFT